MKNASLKTLTKFFTNSFHGKRLVQSINSKNRVSRYVLMRFNVKFKGHPYVDNNDETWLEYRLRLAELTSLWSLKQQTYKDFKLVVLLDPNTPKTFLYKLEAAMGELNYSFLFVDPQIAGLRKLFQDFRKQDAAENIDLIQTTRLDNDDILHPDFLNVVARYERNLTARLPLPLYLSFPTGQQFITRTMSFTNYCHPKNAFGTLFEKNQASAQTVMSFQHTRMIEKFDTVSLASHPGMWCMMIHGNNLLNQEKGEVLDTPYFALNSALFSFLSEPVVQLKTKTV